MYRLEEWPGTNESATRGRKRGGDQFELMGSRLDDGVLLPSDWEYCCWREGACLWRAMGEEAESERARTCSWKRIKLDMHSQHNTRTASTRLPSYVFLLLEGGSTTAAEGRRGDAGRLSDGEDAEAGSD